MQRKQVIHPRDVARQNPRLRTHEEQLRVANNLIMNPGSPDPANWELLIKKRSPLLDIPNFNIIHGVPLDPMHLMDAGNGQTILLHAYCGDKTRTLNSIPGDRSRPMRCIPGVNPILMNQLLRETKVPFDFTRRPRGLDPKWTCMETRNLFIAMPYALIVDIEEEKGWPSTTSARRQELSQLELLVLMFVVVYKYVLFLGH